MLLNVLQCAGYPRAKNCVSSAELRNAGLQHREVAVGRWEDIRDACLAIVLRTRECACACTHAVCAHTCVKQEESVFPLLGGRPI